MLNYSTRVGKRRAKRPARNPYQIAYAEKPDDGRIILHVGDHVPVCADCRVGHLLWAEAGYVSYHRICDTCGSHWDLHPLGMGLGIAYIPPGQRHVTGQMFTRWVDGRGWIPIDPTELLDGHDKATWGDLLALVTPEQIASAETNRGRTLDVPCIPACWAQRARFY